MAEGYVQILTYKHSWNHKETAALGEKIWSVLSAGLHKLQVISLPELFLFQCFIFQANQIITTD